jgi:prepilin-type N-terminal cleavage/methylation domain-containing protein
VTKTRSSNTPYAFSIIELLAALTIIGILAALVLSRATSHVDRTEREACFLNQGEIELQAQLWRRNHGSFPAANLADIGADLTCFPDGLPICPVDGGAYTIDTTTGCVTGHTH